MVNQITCSEQGRLSSEWRQKYSNIILWSKGKCARRKRHLLFAIQWCFFHLLGHLFGEVRLNLSRRFLCKTKFCLQKNSSKIFCECFITPRSNNDGIMASICPCSFSLFFNSSVMCSGQCRTPLSKEFKGGFKLSRSKGKLRVSITSKGQPSCMEATLWLSEGEHLTSLPTYSKKPIDNRMFD